MSSNWVSSVGLILTQEQLGTVAAVIAQRAPAITRPCPMCGQLSWQLEDGIVLHPVADPKVAINVAGVPRVLPTIAVTCISCGYTVFFEIVRLGLLDVLGMKPQG